MYFENIVASKQLTVLSGRYLASRCKVDPKRKQFGIEVFGAIQESLDEDYPGRYYLIAYSVNGSDYGVAYDGNRHNKAAIRIVCIKNFNKKPWDYFGFLGSESKLLGILSELHR